MRASTVGIGRSSFGRSGFGRCALLIAGCIATLVANAAEAPRHENNFEITPFIGYMAGGEFRDPLDGSDRDLKEDNVFGLFADVVTDSPDRHYELIYSQQSSTVKGAIPLDMDVQYLHIGGVVDFIDNPHVTPYIGATVGATRFSPDAVGLDDETKLSFSLGGGLKIPVTDHIGLRFDARGFVSILDSDSNIFCVSSADVNACRITARSDTIFQYSASLGITAAF